MPHCPNCQHEVSGNYCANCGQSLKLKRIDRHYVIHEIEHVLHFEKGILYTIRELLLRPGRNIRSFLHDDRSRLVKPVIFIIITSLFYTLINHAFHLDDRYVKVMVETDSTVKLIYNWIHEHYGYANILMGMSVAFWLKLFFRKSGYNIFEIIILLCFVMGAAMLLLTLFALVEGTTSFPLLKKANFLAIFYCAWAIGNFFNPKRIKSYAVALFAYTLGMAGFYLIAFAIGYAIDIIFKPFG